MKDVIIFYRDNENANAIAFIKNNLEEIFGHYINFTNCFLPDLKPDEKLIADAFLILSDQMCIRDSFCLGELFNIEPYGHIFKVACSLIFNQRVGA